MSSRAQVSYMQRGSYLEAAKSIANDREIIYCHCDTAWALGKGNWSDPWYTMHVYYCVVLCTVQYASSSYSKMTLANCVSDINNASPPCSPAHERSSSPTGPMSRS